MSITPTPGKVTRSGNSKMLPVPAELARAAHAGLGDTYTVELLGDDIIYHRASERALVTGSGADRIGIVPAGRALQMTGRSSVPPLDDWSF